MCCPQLTFKCLSLAAQIWSYSMHQHFADKHERETMPKELAEAVALRYHEKEGTKQLLTKFPKAVKVACDGARCVCKKSPFIL